MGGGLTELEEEGDRTNSNIFFSSLSSVKGKKGERCMKFEGTLMLNYCRYGLICDLDHSTCK